MTLFSYCGKNLCFFLFYHNKNHAKFISTVLLTLKVLIKNHRRKDERKEIVEITGK